VEVHGLSLRHLVGSDASMKTNHLPYGCLLGLLVSLAATSLSWGQTATWNGTGTASWLDTTKWTWTGGSAPSSGLPDTATSVVIGNGGTVQLQGSSQSIVGLTMNNGRLEITRDTVGAVLTLSGAVALGSSTGSVSEVLLDGLGTEFIKTGSNQMHIGASGTATFTVSNQAKLTASAGFHVGLGNSTGSTGKGTLNITTGGQVIVNSTFMVGHRGNGTVNVTDGGYLKTTNGYLSGYGQDGNRVKGTSLVKVSGENSKWDVGSIYVGNAGTGTILVEDLGQVISTNVVYIGYWNGGGTAPTPAPIYGTGTLTVQSSGLFQTSSSLNIGTSGSTGTLNLTSNGRVHVGSGAGTITLGEKGSLNIGADVLLPEAVPAAPGIISAGTVTSAETGSVIRLFHSDQTGAYHLTKTGLAAGAHVTLAGALKLQALSGVTTLIGANTFTGGTEIGGDAALTARMVIKHASALGTGAVVVKANGVLEIAPTITSTLDTLTLEGGSGLAVTLDAAGGDTTPAIQLSQSLSFAGDSEEKIKIYVSGTEAITNPALYDWTLLTASGGIEAEDASRFEVVSDLAGLYVFLRDDSLVLGMNSIVIPEPDRLGLCLVGIGGLAMRRRR